MRFGAIFLTLSLALAMFAACSDDESFLKRPTAYEEDDLSSCSGEDASSSSEKTAHSSSSVKSSSSSVRSSSSSLQSSSSISSSSSSISFTKEEVFNPNINYGELKDGRDGRVYKTVVVGRQVWMAEDLAYEYVVNDSAYNNFCGADSCEFLGRYYSWSAAMDSAGVFSSNGKGCGAGKKCTPTYPVRGVCPEGWHLPSHQEYNTVILYAGGTEEAMTKFKSMVGWKKNEDASDYYGLSFLPGGRSASKGSVEDMNTAFSWTSYEYDDKYAAWFILSEGSSGIVYNHTKGYANAVRCLKDTLVEDSFFDSITIAQPCRTDQEDNCVYGKFTDPRDDQVYRTIKIGNQVWFAENLRYETSISRCHSSGCDTYGRYYLWRDVESNGYMCPEGSHLPSKEEWETLFWAVSEAGPSGKMLKDSTSWKKRKEGDYFGFTILPSRQFYGDTWGTGDGQEAYFWSSTKGEKGVYRLSLFSDSDVCYFKEFEYYTSNYLFSIRCIVDSE